MNDQWSGMTLQMYLPAGKSAAHNYDDASGAMNPIVKAVYKNVPFFKGHEVTYCTHPVK